MRTIVLLTIFTMLYGCNSNDNSLQFNIGVDFEFSVVNKEGNDLLNPENQNYFNHSNIKLFYKVDGECKEVYDENLDHPKIF